MTVPPTRFHIVDDDQPFIFQKMAKNWKEAEIMRILFISLLLLTLVGCANSNLAWHRPALYYYDTKALADQNRQQYPADQNRPQQNFPHVYPYTYTILDW